MGYSTIYIGKFKISGDKDPIFSLYLDTFLNSRRVKRDVKKIKKVYRKNWKVLSNHGDLGEEGEFFACPIEKKKDKSIIAYNMPPSNQPGLWCPFHTFIENGTTYLEWDGAEMAKKPFEWLQYLVEHFFAPNNLFLSGVILTIGEDCRDITYIVADENELMCYYPDEDETTEIVIEKIKDEFINRDIADSCDEICSFTDDIEALLSSQIDDETWEDMYDKFSTLRCVNI